MTFPTLGYGWADSAAPDRDFMEARAAAAELPTSSVRTRTPRNGRTPAAGGIRPQGWLPCARLDTEPEAAADPLAHRAARLALDKAFVGLIRHSRYARPERPMVAGDRDLVFRRPGYLRADDPKDEPAAAAALADSGLLKAFASVLRPLGDLAPSFATTGGTTAPAGQAAEIAELREMMKAQAAEIAVLKARIETKQ